MIKSFSFNFFQLFDLIRTKLWPDYIYKLVLTNPAHKNVKKRNLLIVENNGYKKWAYLLCPCGCKDIIMLSLSKNRRPSWTVNIDKAKRPTIYPSVRRLEGCHSHFWIRNGMIDWCSDTGQLSKK